MRIKKIIKISGIILAIILVISLAGIITINNITLLKPPSIHDDPSETLIRKKINIDHYIIGKNWLNKDSSGLWELYVEGKPFERGVVIGKLTKELIHYQEEVFIDQLQKLVTSDYYLKFLKSFVKFFNRKMDRYIPEEYQEEIYGISLSADSNYDFIGSNYERMINYHAAHDIGHVLADYKMVGCSSFACWGKRSADNSLIIGRNFDFYAGDKFSENKIVSFINPDQGYKFMFITWGGMIGAVSGMNEKGLTVTINAAKSKIPPSAKTPITLISREILQYASNIKEAFDIAKKMKSFVSQSFMIGSLEDNKTVIIEKSPHKTVLFSTDSCYIICTNHFQSEVFNINNKEFKDENHPPKASLKRFSRLKQLIDQYPGLNVIQASIILRDLKGMNGKNIGYGNEESINQLICHHSVIFKPDELKVWVSTSPYQLGIYKCYDLHKIFYIKAQHDQIKSEDIPADTFLQTNNYFNYLKFKILRSEYMLFMKKDLSLNDIFIRDYINSNPDYYLSFLNIGDYFFKMKKFKEALKYYKIAKSKEIPSFKEDKYIEIQLVNCLNKIEDSHSK